MIYFFSLKGGVFVTWRQKDPKGSDLGLYGENLLLSSLRFFF